jgi:D-tyrosyl-tRNA(Tyr) deacylase
MRIVIQRVLEASVQIEERVHAKIKKGLLVFVGVESRDIQEDIHWLSNKICKMRIFNDEQNLMNFSVKDIEGEILVISQFTLQASTKKGNRPSYVKAANPDTAIPLYEAFVLQLQKDLGKNIQTGVFGADMKISLTNDGPVTICMDSKNRI